jgi:hypothetical protein
MKAPRCPKHGPVPPNNQNAENGEAECGGCIMAEVYFLWESRLDVLDVLAGLLISHAQLRTRLSQNERRLAFYEPGILKES